MALRTGSGRPQALVEHALETSTSEQCIVIVNDSTSANLRWANNTLTTNGVMRAVDVTVIAFQGAGNASVSGTAASPEQVSALVESADRAAAVADAAEDRAELVTGDAAGDWDDPPGETSIEVFDAFAARLGEAFGQADAEQRILYGFVFHEVTTTYLGSSTGLRLRHVQPTGHYGCTAKNSALTNSAWVGGATRDFADVDAGQMAADLATRLGWGERRIDLPAGRYDTILPATSTADMVAYAYFEMSARNAQDGRTVFSKPGGGTRIGEDIVNKGVRLYSDPAYPGRECAPFVVASFRQQQRLRQRADDRADGLDRRRPAPVADPDPAQRRHHRAADHPGRGQPHPRRRRRHRHGGRPRRRTRRRAAAHLHVVHP
jgi:predicted Zn-dependent protease